MKTKLLKKRNEYVEERDELLQEIETLNVKIEVVDEIIDELTDDEVDGVDTVPSDVPTLF